MDEERRQHKIDLAMTALEGCREALIGAHQALQTAREMDDWGKQQYVWGIIDQTLDLRNTAEAKLIELLGES